MLKVGKATLFYFILISSQGRKSLFGHKPFYNVLKLMF